MHRMNLICSAYSLLDKKEDSPAQDQRTTYLAQFVLDTLAYLDRLQDLTKQLPKKNYHQYEQQPGHTNFHSSNSKIICRQNCFL